MRFRALNLLLTMPNLLKRLDYSATPQQGELFYPWVIVDYPLAQAVEDRIVKAPLIVRHVSGTKVPPHDPTGISKENVCDKYG